MDKALICDHCGEEFSATSLQARDKTYCCDACAFEAQRSLDCGGRTDSHISAPIVERIQAVSDTEDCQQP